MDTAKNKMRVTNRGIELDGLHYVIWKPAILEVAHRIKKYNLSVDRAKEVLTYYADSIEC